MVSLIVKNCPECPFFRHSRSGKPACSAGKFIPDLPWPDTVLTEPNSLRRIPLQAGMEWVNLVRTRPEWCPLPITIRTRPPQVNNSVEALRHHKRRLERTRGKIEEELVEVTRKIDLQLGGSPQEIAAMAETIAEHLQSNPRGMSLTTIYRDIFSNNKYSKFIKQSLNKLRDEDRAICKKVQTDGRSKEVWISTNFIDHIDK